MSERLSAERLARIRDRIKAFMGLNYSDSVALFAELDAVTLERDVARKDLEERGQMLFDEQMARQRAERERDKARVECEDWKHRAFEMANGYR